ncbi:hypothetical protein BDZ88DRAFT_504535 [Geranomyces variabilis]|nr:hypothetical protein BDZ88DRAFT_504535 [Geranomyces variabilis]KAJ3142425.1 hypothetical protein HDU90_004699 [Geranomyces variabilis]
MLEDTDDEQQQQPESAQAAVSLPSPSPPLPLPPPPPTPPSRAASACSMASDETKIYIYPDNQQNAETPRSDNAAQPHFLQEIHDQNEHSSITASPLLTRLGTPPAWDTTGSLTPTIERLAFSYTKSDADIPVVCIAPSFGEDEEAKAEEEGAGNQEADQDYYHSHDELQYESHAYETDASAYSAQRGRLNLSTHGLSVQYPTASALGRAVTPTSTSSRTRSPSSAHFLSEVWNSQARFYNDIYQFPHHQTVAGSSGTQQGVQHLDNFGFRPRRRPPARRHARAASACLPITSFRSGDPDLDARYASPNDKDPQWTATANRPTLRSRVSYGEGLLGMLSSWWARTLPRSRSLETESVFTPSRFSTFSSDGGHRSAGDDDDQDDDDHAAWRHKRRTKGWSYGVANGTESLFNETDRETESERGTVESDWDATSLHSSVHPPLPHFHAHYQHYSYPRDSSRHPLSRTAASSSESDGSDDQAGEASGDEDDNDQQENDDDSLQWKWWSRAGESFFSDSAPPPLPAHESASPQSAANQQPSPPPSPPTPKTAALNGIAASPPPLPSPPPPPPRPPPFRATTSPSPSSSLSNSRAAAAAASHQTVTVSNPATLPGSVFPPRAPYTLYKVTTVFTALAPCDRHHHHEHYYPHLYQQQYQFRSMRSTTTARGGGGGGCACPPVPTRTVTVVWRRYSEFRRLYDESRRQRTSGSAGADKATAAAASSFAFPPKMPGARRFRADVVETRRTAFERMLSVDNDGGILDRALRDRFLGIEAPAPGGGAAATGAEEGREGKFYEFDADAGDRLARAKSWVV